MNQGDRAFLLLLRFVGICVLVLIFAIMASLAHLALPSIREYGLGFFLDSIWNPSASHFGGLVTMYGTVSTSFLALILALPLCVGVALFLTEVCHPKLETTLGFLIEMLAAIPSVVYGFWGIYALLPLLRDKVYPILINTFEGIPVLSELFKGPSFGVGTLSASIVLAIMISPTIVSITREIFRAIPDHQREAALALGATRAEMMIMSVLKSGIPGIVAAAVLGLGRAIGETMAVTMLIGNRNVLNFSLMGASQTMASLIANEYPEATEELHVASLAFVGLGLFVLSFFINTIAQLVLKQTQKRVGSY